MAMMTQRRSWAWLLGTYALLSAIALGMLLPLLWLVSTAFKSGNENIFEFPPRFLPAEPTFSNFITVWQQNPFGQYFFNSIIVAVLTVGLNLLFCSLAAYPLARLRFAGREALFALIVATILIPFQIVMIPLYVLAVQLGLRNSYLGIILPFIASAFGIFLMRQAFLGVPKELEEAARMDGCSELGVWWHVMIFLHPPRPSHPGHLCLHRFVERFPLAPDPAGPPGILHPAPRGGPTGRELFPRLALDCRWLGDFHRAGAAVFRNHAALHRADGIGQRP
jgi:ABC-type glycerol-3-phosphate transport system permease component